MNQTLEGHNGTGRPLLHNRLLATHLTFCVYQLLIVMVVTWNENYRKLTTSDQYGLIIGIIAPKVRVPFG
jgi:hypothetical protein